MLDTLAKIVTIVVGVLTVWQILASKTDLPVGKGPAAIVQKDGGSTTTIPTFPTTLPTTTKPEKLATPSGVSVSGDCNSGFTLTWDPVEDAEQYRIEADGSFAGFTSGTSKLIHAFPDGNEHRYHVVAHAFGRDSDPSDDVSVGPCSF